MNGMPPPKPIPIKDRHSAVWVARCRIDVEDGAFVQVTDDGTRIQTPVGMLTCIFLEPGTSITHAAVVLAARVGCLLVWTGEGGVRLYAAGQPGGSRTERLQHQAKLLLDDTKRLEVVRNMYRLRFGEEPPLRRSLDQLRGMEAVRVKETYKLLAAKFGVKWNGRKYNPAGGLGGSDLPNLCLSAANSCLYGLSEAAILASGYAPALGFLHSGKPLSFVYDVADIVKFETVAPIAFSVARDDPDNPERETRIRCRDMFRQTKLLKRLVPLIEEILTIEGEKPPEVHPEALPIAFEGKEKTGDVGHRA